MFDLFVLLAQESDSWWDNLNPMKWIKSLTTGVFQGVKRFFCWVILKGLTWAETFANFLLSLLPDLSSQTSGYLATIGSAASKVDSWVPVSTLFACISTYLMVCAAIAAIRFVKSWIPTLGG